MPEISVIIPCYNVEKYLRKCLDSVVNQTFQDIEIICIDDGSVDSSLDILNEYKKNDKRIKVISQKNGGLSSARNTGLNNVSGKYVYFLDSDDFTEPTLFEKAVGIFNNFDIDYYCFGSEVFTDGECIQSANKMNDYIKIKREGLFELNFAIGLNTNIHVWNKIFKRNIIENYKIKFVNGLLYEDIYFMWYYLFVSKTAYFDKTVYHYYRMRKDSIMEKTTKNKTFKNGIAHLYNWHELFVSFSKNSVLIKKYFDELLYLLNCYTKRTIEMVPDDDKNRVLLLKKQYRKELFEFCPDKKFIYFFKEFFLLKQLKNSSKKEKIGRNKKNDICKIPKMLVCLHIYYSEQTDFFIKRLKNISNCEWDLCITLNEKKKDLIDKILKFKPDTKIFFVNNIGYDIFPFIYILREINIAEYDYIMKLHTKNYQNQKPYWHGRGWHWRNTLVNSIIGSKKNFQKCLKLLQNNSTGEVGAAETLVYMGDNAPEDTYLYSKICKKYGLSDKKGHFIAGSMFIAKANLMNVIKNLPCNEQNFEISAHTGDKATLAHVIERFLGVLVEQQGYEIAGSNT